MRTGERDEKDDDSRNDERTGDDENEVIMRHAIFITGKPLMARLTYKVFLRRNYLEPRGIRH